MQTDKPPRPFGVTLAILVSVILYAVIPLMQVGLVLAVADHFRNRDSTITLPNGEELTEVASGGEFIGDISTERLILQGTLALGFLVVAFFAWRGKPSFMRYVLMGSVLLLTAITLALTVIPGLQSGGRGISGGSLDNLSTPLLCLQLFVSFFVPLYVVWYLNRAPARAFYQGRSKS